MSALAERHVLQLCHSYSGPFLDCARQYASLFRGRGYKVTTAFLTGEAAPHLAAECGSDEVQFLGFSSADVRGLKLGAIAALRKLVSARDYAFCIAHRFKPLYVALLGTRLPVIGVHHGFGDYERAGRRLFANLFRTRLSLLGVSDAVRDDMRRCLPGWPAERIETLYNRIDLAERKAQLLPRSEARQALGLADGDWVIGNVGRLHPDKDQATLLQGFALARSRLPANARLVIMGEGRLEDALKRQAEQAGIDDVVLFAGQVPQGARYFSAFDAFALTSDHEPFGMVLLEAMSAGVPLVATDCGGAREVVEGVGELFALRDSQALANALVRVASLDPEQRRALAEAMSKRVTARFSDQAVADTFWRLPMVQPRRPA
ncbi:glycosyltransferase [Pseudomonas sp. KNUC1026]|uniref:glycosyltransferase n=1 Tax=Pseudomonas sp. KNUC1026 TaxID=2893890 RepID=UPI001F3DACA6|nr:glycosyltransferase [Pseudomonas sp. KNUC1026]UFH49729.1 glycosyltransferase [Pseudomonas sp. KNUC1026]